MYSMPKGGQAEVTMLGVSTEGAGLTKENFMLTQTPQTLLYLRKISFAKTTEVLFICQCLLLKGTDRHWGCRLAWSRLGDISAPIGLS